MSVALQAVECHPSNTLLAQLGTPSPSRPRPVCPTLSRCPSFITALLSPVSPLFERHADFSGDHSISVQALAVNLIALLANLPF